jgi:hypothetical protein
MGSAASYFYIYRLTGGEDDRRSVVTESNVAIVNITLYLCELDRGLGYELCSLARLSQSELLSLEGWY